MCVSGVCVCVCVCLYVYVCACVCVSAVPPGPPVARVMDTTDHSIDVEWDAPLDNGGGEILGYHVDKVSLTLAPYRTLRT